MKEMFSMAWTLGRENYYQVFCREFLWRSYFEWVGVLGRSINFSWQLGKRQDRYVVKGRVVLSQTTSEKGCG